MDAWISGKLKLDKNKRRFGRFSYENSKGLSVLRYTIFGLFVVCLFAGFGTFVQLLAPYSSFGRIVTMLLQPLYEMGTYGFLGPVVDAQGEEVVIDHLHACVDLEGRNVGHYVDGRNELEGLQGLDRERITRDEIHGPVG